MLNLMIEYKPVGIIVLILALLVTTNKIYKMLRIRGTVPGAVVKEKVITVLPS